MWKFERVAQCAVVAVMLVLSAQHVAAQTKAPASAPREPLPVRIVEMPPPAPAPQAVAASEAAPNRTEQLTEYDLSAQLRSAQAAEEQVAVASEALVLTKWNFWLSLLALLASSVSVWALLKSLDHTRQSTEASALSAKASADSATVAREALDEQKLAQDRAKNDVARSLYIELAHHAARCCYDGENGWARLRRAGAPQSAASVRKFAPGRPQIFEELAGRLGVLSAEAAVALMAFYYRIEGLRREIENVVGDAETVDPKKLPILVTRHEQTLRPAQEALFRLRETIADSPEIDALSLARFDNEGLRISPVNKDEPGNDAALLNRLATLIAAMDKRDEL